VNRSTYKNRNVGHPTVRCPTLKLPRPSASVTGNGTEETIFLQLPNSVFKGHLKPKNTLVAKVTITLGLLFRRLRLRL
jgi:hypothetical protein